jgi:orotidine-5'-phosphate decarboxylase
MTLSEKNQFLKNSIKDKIIVALDVPNRELADKIIEQTYDYVGYYKIGLGFLAHNGIDYATELAKQGVKIFLDLKLFDIPQTITDSVARLAEKTQAKILTVHGDQYIVSAAIKGRILSGRTDLNLYAVTILTSLNQTDITATGYNPTLSLNSLVLERAKLAANAGADGVISSAQEVHAIKALGLGLKVITPGIRTTGSLIHDQKRIMTPTEAIEQGSDHLVIGREITQSTNPKETAFNIFQQIEDKTK